ncbi:polysaccharide deacetylase [Treponema sp. R8-4-B8]
MKMKKMMRNKLAPLIAPLFALILPFVLIFSCKTINRGINELHIPQSIVYFSFDDGPNAQGDSTARLLDVLKKYQIKAMFCLLGENAERYPDLVKRIYAEGHYIANHGYSEKWASKMNDEQFRDNLVRGDAAISAALGFDVFPKLYRPHGGFFTSAQEKIIHDAGYAIVTSTIRVYDAVTDGTKRGKVVKQVVKKVEKQGGGFVLLHDARDSYAQTEERLAKDPHGVFDRSWIPDAVEEIIIILLKKGYILNNPDILTAIND